MPRFGWSLASNWLDLGDHSLVVSWQKRYVSSLSIRDVSWRHGVLTEVEQVDEAVWYDIPFSASDYTFPREACINAVYFDNLSIYLELTDGRVLSIPLWWIPSLYHAAPAERVRYTIQPDRKTIVWDPDRCAINDELCIDDYLCPQR